MSTAQQVTNPARTSAGVLGFALLVLGSLSLLCLSVGASGSAWNSPTVYTKVQFVLAGALTLLGLVPLMLSRVLAATAATAAVIGAQLMGAGMVAFQHWKPASGINSFAFSSYFLVRSLAVVLAVSGLLAACGSVLTLARRAAFSFTRMTPGASRCVVGIGVSVLVGLPPMLGLGSASSLDLTSLGSAVLLYSLPLGGGLIVVAWLARTPALAVVGTVATSAVLAGLGKHMIFIPNPEFGFVLVLAAAFAVLVVRLLEPADHRRR